MKRGKGSKCSGSLDELGGQVGDVPFKHVAGGNSARHRCAQMTVFMAG